MKKYPDGYIDKIIHGDCFDVMKNIPDDSVDLVATDPPYGYSFMGKNWDRVIMPVKYWKECLRVLKPGAICFVMSAPRQDVLSRAIINLQDAGFDTGFTSIYWAYASGFPKAANIGKVVDKKLGLEREVIGVNKNSMPGLDNKNTEFKMGFRKQKGSVSLNTKSASLQAKSLDGSYAGFQPKPAVEIIIVTMKPIEENTYVDQAMKNQKGITWLDDCRIPHDEPEWHTTRKPRSNDITVNNKSCGFNSEKTTIASANPKGRFPANLLVSDDVLNDGNDWKGGQNKSQAMSIFGNDMSDRTQEKRTSDSGSFSRYFDLDKWAAKTFPFLIVPKADKGEKDKWVEGVDPKYMDESRKVGSPGGTNPRNRAAENPRRNYHPTVKPMQLMAYLIVLGSREKDIILDPFIGSGTTAIACKELGRRFIGIEINPEYCKIAEKRLAQEILF